MIILMSYSIIVAYETFLFFSYHDISSAAFVPYLRREKFYWKSPYFLAQISTITTGKITYNIKSTEYCDFYCGSQPVAKQKSAFKLAFSSNFDFLGLNSSVAYGRKFILGTSEQTAKHLKPVPQKMGTLQFPSPMGWVFKYKNWLWQIWESGKKFSISLLGIFSLEPSISLLKINPCHSQICMPLLTVTQYRLIN